MLVFVTNQYIFQCIPYLILFPKYICPLLDPYCTPQDHCRSPEHYPVDISNPLSLNNWVEQLNLACENPYKIALLGSMYFAGAIASGLFVTRLGDTHGRKLPTLISAIVSIPIHLGLMLSRNLNLSIALFFFLGLTRPGKMQVAFVYVSEMVPERYRRRVGSFILFFDGGSLIMFALYFKYISKSWLYFQIWALLMSIVSTLVLFKIPESPKFLIKKGRFDDARVSLLKIAGYNNVYNSQKDIIQNHLFEGEITTSKGSSCESIMTQVGGGTLSEFVKDRAQLVKLVIFVFMWMAQSFSYYLAFFMTRKMEGDFFLNTFVYSGTELFSHLFVGLIINKLSVNAAYLIAFLTACFSSMMYCLLRVSNPEYVPFFLGLLIFGIIFSTNTNWNSNQFLFPVIYASSTNGLCNIFARGINIVSPQIAELDQPTPMIVIGVTCFVAALMSLMLKPMERKQSM
ncbi:hypothetical protein FGO68_gene574 [Halteria grandinella]|uniref:Major facilitator superfamily (MFS) profile domain-containing protein n=1 Tax=Halteria grandinella TaxID=5974 RepID=A0A8J8NSG4_HALGN|nr:hypothetical protein FGO68_gene574 [Halteria grandinella]